MVDPRQKELLSHFFEHSSRQLNRCLAPGMRCKATAIRAHSIQNSQVLDLLARDGHVKGLTRRIDKDNGPIISFDDVGQNQATVFEGFCSEHDSDIFKAIDRNPFCLTEHLFLVAYRAVARELHAQMDGAAKIQGTYQKRVQLGIDNSDEPTETGMLAVEHFARSYFTYLYKCSFDEALVFKKHGAVLHHLIPISHDEPTIAVCSHLALDNLSRNGEAVRLTLNVLPIGRTKSAAVFSYLPHDAAPVKSALNRILSSEGVYQKYLLSKLALNNCENFVVSPSYFDKWSDAKKQAITDYFVETLAVGNLEVENQNLYLF